MEYNEIIGIDHGLKRIGVARVSSEVKIPQPLEAIDVDGTELSQIVRLVDEHKATFVVVGWPRSLIGEPTQQTKIVDEFAAELSNLGIEVKKQDEALTSEKAKQEMKDSGRDFKKSEIDSLSAVYILEDYLRDNHEI